MIIIFENDIKTGDRMKNTFILTLLAISLHAPSALADDKEKESLWNKTADSAKDTIESSKKTGAIAWEATKETSADVWQETKEVSTKVSGSVGENVGELGKEIKENGQAVWKDTKEISKKVAEKTDEESTSLWQSIKNLFN
jgi:gas vesicle protein